ncbi:MULTISPECIES: bifunctional proline dehydrogenase/L-glutamate gamma-semialdehyde dehydrogenase PutA [unclassified Wenzhouxiangella]|uniref:bifunctional proline dehydrogenase/L-glutamate gamma-semialdehyde dehydrogenase PutA n=1 Tax=unclassified Wenzhouxiangella TaxID=2613841 RepID=UPI000E327613|nr:MULTISPECIES: bifunctional proline dehydrogenase/L-glutamate gamma-semialdehyde dehydrogenase PutA [unclassified Wenzhouxiangella]RFF26827.1 bifunctional proline dehydrogenase/L-glutamate gamma-semialdehyde dehydrogenase PutA [Wenzhouxiangella sp. 15181]RFP68520.1 bifunctional proline dehydrogenase/L-glutamate gamma-semialdehyde dehydrogenase PutA [Wenzhouxiangella sp. 15190]
MSQASHPFVTTEPFALDERRKALDDAWQKDEAEHVRFLLEELSLNNDQRQSIRDNALELVKRVRERSRDAGVMEAFMHEYDLSSEEGVILMCLAEALLRIPDNDTAEKLISDKLSDADWESHLGKSSSVFVNAGTWGLMLTGRLVSVKNSEKRSIGTVLSKIANKSGEPVVRTAIRQAMRIMGHQYVMGRTIKEAMERSKKKANKRFRYSFDMLGEAALTAADARRYYDSYAAAIDAIGQAKEGDNIFALPSISVKLSALHPRYEHAKHHRLMDELVPRLLKLARQARKAGIALTVDAEEADRLDASFDVIAAVLADPELEDWDGFGLALQAYQKRAWTAIDWLAEQARETGHRIPVRLTKGAYWDTEIKLAQIEGVEDYPVFTRKANTDVSFIACADKLLSMPDCFYPQFATHNAHTIATIAELAGPDTEYEYQRLHGMGQDLYEEVLDSDSYNGQCRVYAPVGNHKDLLPYLVRRLLENGANTSFVNRIVDEKLPVEKVVEDPIAEVQSHSSMSHPRIPLPGDLYGRERRNSRGINMARDSELAALKQGMEKAEENTWSAEPTGKAARGGEESTLRSPVDTDLSVGKVTWTAPDSVEKAVAAAVAAQQAWDGRGAAERADILNRIGDLYEEHCAELMAICAREGGKSLFDGIAEVREAVDFCRYYAMQARNELAEPVELPGPTGESNTLRMHGKGVFVCISPWNFPLAIFTGQIVAALVAGNAVVAKPAEQTPLVAARAVALMHEAGVPDDVIQCLPGDGKVGAALTGDPRIAGVAFTGSTETARIINRTLAEREGPIATLIAETGGQNAMVVDSSALPEQVVADVIHSAFLSAGQRCSALRVLYVQSDVADRMLEMLSGAMQEIAVGDPGLLETDIGPIIDEAQLEMLNEHAERMDREAKLIAKTPLRDDLPPGHWFAPRAYEIDGIDRLEREIFGPVLHVVRYKASELDEVIDKINGTGYGLTLGVHSRIDRVYRYIAHRAHVGNAYVNRNMTGAVVGVQPFGGEGLSGTGPKAGGPHYLYRFVTERTLTNNTAAIGGNASLMALSE